jgi:hypothetical protein
MPNLNSLRLSAAVAVVIIMDQDFFRSKLEIK